MITRISTGLISLRSAYACQVGGTYTICVVMGALHLCTPKTRLQYQLDLRARGHPRFLFPLSPLRCISFARPPGTNASANLLKSGLIVEPGFLEENPIARP
ncbi:hypothetical protein C8Q78DRAFT_77408 [Trametes maxima]|nr:hypothetical protein C8Q78DRAFT_77408 [Trametes maxima]